VINIIGIDPSLTHTAGFHAMGHLTAPELRGFSITTKPKDHAHPIARLRHLRDALARELDTCASALAPGYVFVEGYAFGAKCAREALGEWGGLVRLLAFERGWTVIVVPPTVLKLFVCGKGTAPKELMMLEVFKRWKYSATDNNDADAHALMRLGLEWCAAKGVTSNDTLEGSKTDLPRSTKRTAEVLAKLEQWAAAA
jgi:Holliday junction resolvasome RuvABC endonuclease subunit